MQTKGSPYSVLLVEGRVQKQTKCGYRPTWNASTMGSKVKYEGALPLSAKELPVVCTLPPKGIQKLTALRFAIKNLRRFNMDFVVRPNPSSLSISLREKLIISLSANDMWFYQKRSTRMS